MVPVSVVVPTLDREEILERALASFLNQDYGSYEIVVVDQSTADPSPELDFLVKNNKKIKYFRMKKRGSPIARNFGVREASGEIIISCDDDIVVPPSWISAHVRNYDDPMVGAVTGRVLTETERDVSQISEVGTFDWRTGNLINNSDASFRTEVDHAYGCNMSFRKKVFVEVGGFDPAFMTLGYFEEADLSLRIRKLGQKIIFEPEAVVVHF